jgi:hypothetical protein
MSTQDFITQLFCRVDDQMTDVAKHSQSSLYPSEIVTLALLFAIKGVGNRAFYRWIKRWIKRDYLPLFPALPERTRLFRLFATHQQWADRFLAEPTIMGVADSYGIELVHPYREGRAKIRGQIGKKGFSNHRWIVGGKLGLVLNKWGLVAEWDCNTANVHDSTFHPMVARLEDQMGVLTDHGFYSKAGNPSNMVVCEHGRWNTRMMVETVLSMLTTVCHIKDMTHRVWRYLQAHLAFCLAAFNILAQWYWQGQDAPETDQFGRVHLSIAEFSL